MKLGPSLALSGALLVAGAACSDPAPSALERPAETPEALARAMRAAVDELRARPEQSVERIVIQHLLVAVRGGGVTSATRSPAEAEALTAELFARARAGEDFDLLVKIHTDDVYPGTLVLSSTADDPPRVYARSQMKPGLIEVAWRLAVGELGVALHDGGAPGQAPPSPLGYHLIRRLE